MNARTILRLPVLLLAVAPLGSAQSSGFPAGEVLVYNPFVTGTASQGSGAIVRYDPAGGQASIVTALEGPSFRPGSICFDPFRDTVLFFGNPGPPGPLQHLWAVNAAGQLTNLGFQGDKLQLFSPGAGGRIYLHDETAVSAAVPLRYLDSANVRHDLMDSSGSAPFNSPGLYLLSAMAYDPGTNSLLVGLRSSGGAPFCSGGTSAALTVLGLRLSADGGRVQSVECSQFTPDPLGANYPVSLTRMGDGDFLLAVDTNSNLAQPRFLRVNPATMSISTFATNGPYTGAAITDAACWSSRIGKALFLNNYLQRPETFVQGSSSGTPIATSMPLTTPGQYGFTMTMVEVPEAGCASTVGFYCTAKTTSSGCVPKLSTSGSPSASAGSGFVIRADQIQSGKVGMLIYGKSGAAAIPFQGGYLCISGQVTRTSGLFSGGATPCAGVYTFDFNAHTAGGNDAALTAGKVVHAQYWFRDPDHPVAGTGLSGGVTFTLCP